MKKINPQYKDRLFSFIFGREENREWTLSLYNAVNGSAYADPEQIEFTTIRQVLYLGMHNDVSFLISEEMQMYEEQSYYCPNMPLRMLQYTGNLYEKYIKRNKLNKFGYNLLRLPVPKLVVFFIGTKELPEEMILNLRDSFPEGSDPDIDVRVRLININPGKNEKLKEACQALKEYALLMEIVRENRPKMGLEKAVELAIHLLPEDSVLRPFLIEHRAEVIGMLLTEYDEVEQMELFREEGREEGENQLAKLLSILFKKGLLKDAERAVADQSVRMELYRKYQLM